VPTQHERDWQPGQLIQAVGQLLGRAGVVDEHLCALGHQEAGEIGSLARQSDHTNPRITKHRHGFSRLP
jgi:hypothetical protein